MQDKKVIALIILVVLAAISLIYGITASPKRGAKSTTVAMKEVTEMPPQAAETTVGSVRRAKRSQYKMWKRNPFSSGQADSTMSDLTLSGIVWNKSRPKAMIGDAIVVKGDTIGNNRVVDIQPDKVILNDGTKDFELRIEK